MITESSERMFLLRNAHVWMKSGSDVSNGCWQSGFPPISLQWLQKSMRSIVGVLGQIQSDAVPLFYTLFSCIYFCFIVAKSTFSPSLKSRVEGWVRCRTESKNISKGANVLRVVWVFWRWLWMNRNMELRLAVVWKPAEVPFKMLLLQAGTFAQFAVRVTKSTRPTCLYSLH